MEAPPKTPGSIPEIIDGLAAIRLRLDAIRAKRDSILARHDDVRARLNQPTFTSPLLHPERTPLSIDLAGAMPAPDVTLDLFKKEEPPPAPILDKAGIFNLPIELIGSSAHQRSGSLAQANRRRRVARILNPSLNNPEAGSLAAPLLLYGFRRAIYRLPKTRLDRFPAPGLRPQFYRVSRLTNKIILPVRRELSRPVLVRKRAIRNSGRLVLYLT